MADLSARKRTHFDLTPDADARAALAATLDLSGLRKLTFAGSLDPVGRRDWRLTAQLGATVVQPCVITLEPVTTRIEEPVERVFIADWVAPDAAELEMPESTNDEPLPEIIDVSEIMAEALELALPQYPRAPGAELGAQQFTEPGKTPMSDADAKPFAALARLKLVDGGGDGGT